MILLTSTTPAAATASAFPSSALEELKIGLNGFNELVLPIFGRHSSPLGGEWRSSSPETGRPAATPLRRGVLFGRFFLLAFDPDFAVFEIFFFPDGNDFLEFVDGVMAGIECGVAVGGCDDHCDAGLADVEMAKAVDHGNAVDVPRLAH